ncbi:polysaccharide biosynthesis tyrosine autokinase [Actinomycetospora sp. OC33-EN08]|uniref:Polysaccharide biosynthesis tyrosine autokinase n=1 Tax=Actinomycetospora aurantiaca TaxID=3129233 RepID=A0ABU8MGE9_9PSEU
MTFPSLLRALRDRWLLLVAGVLVGLLAATVTTLFIPRSYASTTSLYVFASDVSRNSQDAYQGSLLSQQRVKSYAELIVSARVLQPAIDRAGLRMSVDDLADEVTVTSGLDSTILGVTVADADPQRAAAVSNAIAGRFIEVVGELERPREAGAAPSVDVNVIDPAVADPSPVSPLWWVNLLVGGGSGLLLAAGAVLVWGSLDTRLRTAAELAQRAGAMSLGAVPVSPALSEGSAPDAVDDPAYAEAIRRVRTNLLFASVDEPPRSLLVTSSVAAEGKTTVVSTLAAAYAQTGRVIVVEGDLRRPALAGRLGLVDAVGLTDVLTRRVSLSMAVQPWGNTGVDVLVCGTVPPNPSELLSSRSMRELVDELAGTYDLVIIDGPPLLPVTDASVLSVHVDGVLLLARAGSTTAGQVDQAVESLTAVGAKVVGSVLTLSEPVAGGTYYAAVPSSSFYPAPVSPAVGFPQAEHSGPPTVQLSPQPGRAPAHAAASTNGRKPDSDGPA